MIAPVAVIGPRVDLGVNDPIELCAGRVLLRRGARDEGSGAEDDPPAATSLARLNVTRNPRLSHRTRAYRQPHSECPRNRERTNAACSRLGTRGLRRWERSSISTSSTNTTRSPKRHARTSSTRRRQSNTAELTRRSIPRGIPGSSPSRRRASPAGRLLLLQKAACALMRAKLLRPPRVGGSRPPRRPRPPPEPCGAGPQLSVYFRNKSSPRPIMSPTDPRTRTHGLERLSCMYRSLDRLPDPWRSLPSVS